MSCNCTFVIDCCHEEMTAPDCWDNNCLPLIAPLLCPCYASFNGSCCCCTCKNLSFGVPCFCIPACDSCDWHCACCMSDEDKAMAAIKQFMQ